jgi:hypothetical protein
MERPYVIFVMFPHGAIFVVHLLVAEVQFVLALLAIAC